MLALSASDEIDLTIGERYILENLEEAGEQPKCFDQFETRHFRRLLNAGYVTTQAQELGTGWYAITADGRAALVKARLRWPSTHPLKGL
jgi:hypothetical protein